MSGFFANPGNTWHCAEAGSGACWTSVNLCTLRKELRRAGPVTKKHLHAVTCAAAAAAVGHSSLLDADGRSDPKAYAFTPGIDEIRSDLWLSIRESPRARRANVELI